LHRLCVCPQAQARKRAEEEAARLAAELGIGTYELKGDRGYMEDRVIACRLPSGELFSGCYDGHCGEGCPEYVVAHLHNILQEMPSFREGPLGDALSEAFLETNRRFIAQRRRTAPASECEAAETHAAPRDFTRPLSRLTTLPISCWCQVSGSPIDNTDVLSVVWCVPRSSLVL
jgi:hypothetical protein